MLTSQQLIEKFFHDLFAEYDNQNISYCILRNYETLPTELTSGDVDIRILSKDRSKNREIVISVSRKNKIKIFHDYIDERFDQFILFKRISSNDLFSIKLDYYDLELYGVRLLSGADTVRTRVPYRKFFVASDIFKVLDKWLFCYLLNAPLPQKYHHSYKDIFISNREIFSQKISGIFGSRYGDDLCMKICDTGFVHLPKVGKVFLFRILFRLALKEPLFHFHHIPKFIYYRIKHTLFPKGEFISVSGPDGCGKTTVLEQATVQLVKLFGSQPGNHGHFRPSVLPRIANVAQKAGVVATVDEDYSSPHRGRPSGFWGSLFRLLYYSADYIWGYFRVIRPALVRRELVIYDRYYFDMVADPGRSRVNLPNWIRKAFLYLLPLPKTAFFIHAPAETVLQRKQELSLAKIEELNTAYLELARISRLQVLENVSSPDVTAAKLVDTVVARRRKRLGLDRLYP